MRIHSKVLAALLALVVVLSGCSGGDAGGSGIDAVDPEAPTGFDDATGAISGLVIDDAFQPVDGATVTLDGRSSRTTDALGRFGFGFVAPGTRALAVAHPAYTAASQQITVTAGQLSEVQVTIVRQAVAEAYHETFIGNGMVGCSIAWYTAGALGAPSAAVCTSLGFVGLNDLDHSFVDYGTAGLADDVVGAWGETTFQSTQALGNRMLVAWLARSHGDLPATGANINITGSESPVRVPLTVEDFQTVELSGNRVCADWDCLVTGAHYARAHVGSTADVVVMIQQTFTDYLTVFHKGEFPYDFTALPDA